MDLTKPVGYRGFPLNNAHVESAAGPNTGCLIERVSYSNVQGVGYTEKRALGDGLDAGDVFLSGRRIAMSGTLHGATPGELFDLKQDLLSAFNPTLAYASAPYNFGYQPLDWYEPTNDAAFADGFRHVYANVRASGLPTFDIVRDRLGYPNANKGLALEWAALVEAKDPRIYVVEGITNSTDFFFDYNTATSGAGQFLNRGDYPAPMYVLLDVGVTTADKWWHFIGGGAALTLKVPVLSTGGVIRYDGNLKIVTLTVGSIETLRMDLLDLDAEQQHPLIQPGDTDWSWATNTTAPAALAAPLSVDNEVETGQQAVVAPLAAGLSRFWFDEAFS